jgi:WD40 repeat protein
MLIKSSANTSGDNMESTEARKEADSQQPSYAFDIFLSYSRKDGKFAARLENALESYRFPRSLKRVKRNLNVFRDESDIAAAEDYHRTIEKHIRGSAKLIVICSPDARSSPYVEDEIRRFIQTHGEQDIIPVLVRGRANNETSDESERAFPEILCENRMPLHSNFLGCDMYKGKLSKGPFRSSFYQVLAATSGIERRRLEQIDEKVRTRRRTLTLVTASAIIAILSVALFFAVISQRRAVAATNEATLAKNGALAAARSEMIAKDEALAAAKAEKKAKDDALAAARAEEKAKNEAVAAAKAEEKAKNEAIAQKNAAERLLYASNVALATQAYSGGNVERTQALLNSPSVVAGQESPRGFEWYYLSSLYNRKLASFTPHKTAITSMAFSPDGKTIATGSDRTFKLWDVATQQHIGTLGNVYEDSKRDTAVAFSPDGKLIATVTDKGFQIWDAASLTSLATLETGENLSHSMVGPDLNTVAFSPNGKMVAACLDGICQLWDVASRKLLTPPRDLSAPPDASTLNFYGTFAFSPDSTLLAFTADKVKIWDFKTQSIAQILDVDSINCLGFLPDGKLFASGGYNNKLHVFKPDATTKLFAPLSPYAIEDNTSKVVFSPDGKTFVTASDSELVYRGGVQLWDTDSRKLLATFDGLGTRGSVSMLAFSPDGQTLAISSETSLQLSDARVRRSIEQSTAANVQSGILQLKASPDNTKFVALLMGSSHYAVKLWDRNMNLLETFDVGLSEVLAFSTDGKTLATGNKDSGVSLRDISRQPYTEYALPSNRPCNTGGYYDWPESAAFQPRSQTIAIGSTYCMQWWDIEKKKYLPAPAEYQQYQRDTHRYTLVTYSPDGRLLAARFEGDVIVIDATTRQKLVVIWYSSPLSPNSLAFSPDSKSLAVGTKVVSTSSRPLMREGGTVDIWDVSSIKTSRKDVPKWQRTSPFPLLATLEGHGREVTAVAFSTDGKTLASSSMDRTVKLWSVTTYQPLVTLDAGDNPVSALTYSSDNLMLLGGDASGGIKVWRAPRDGEKKARNISPSHP